MRDFHKFWVNSVYNVLAETDSYLEYDMPGIIDYMEDKPSAMIDDINANVSIIHGDYADYQVFH